MEPSTGLNLSSYKNRNACSLAAVIVLIMVTAVVFLQGKSNRVFSSETITYNIDSPEKAFKIWKENEAKGRILLLFDNYPHMRGVNDYKVAPQLTQSNLVEYSVFKNIIRKIYFIVPDAKWEEFRQQKEMQPIREVPLLDRGQYLYNLNGLPLIAVPQSSLPHISEKPLVYVNASVFNHGEVVGLLAQKKIVSDIVLTYQSGPK